MKIALGQLNPTIGDIAGNFAKAREAIARAQKAGADLLALPEMFLSGYPPRDLLLQEGFLEDVHEAATELARGVAGVVVVIGTPWRIDEADRIAVLRNSLLVMRDGAIAARYDKRLLPTYDVFDEARYFTEGDRAVVIEVAGARVGLTICEDLWRGEDIGVSARYRLRADPVAELAKLKVDVLVNPSASPFALRKHTKQREVLASAVRRLGAPVVSVNQVGANDELVFGGHSAVLCPGELGDVQLLATGRGFAEDFVIVDVPGRGVSSANVSIADPLIDARDEELLFDALVLGVRDYCRKTGFEQVALGLSGGIDSTVVACVAVAALGSENVLGVSMPSRYSSEHSVTDAVLLAKALGMRCVSAPIEGIHEESERLLAPLFEKVGASPDAGVAEENVQSRIRGLILMAFSNKMESLLLTTGNKSELAVGYCTLYGDMNGGLAVISDVTKLQVYALARWINENHERCGFSQPPTPEDVLTKAPSAELRPEQTDQDTLPPYATLDEVVERYVESRQSPQRIALETGISRELVIRIVGMIDRAEHKRRQTPVGLKVSNVAFGVGRRMPIAQGRKHE